MGSETIVTWLSLRPVETNLYAYVLFSKDDEVYPIDPLLPITSGSPVMLDIRRKSNWSAVSATR